MLIIRPALREDAALLKTLIYVSGPGYLSRGYLRPS